MSWFTRDVNGDSERHGYSGTKLNGLHQSSWWNACQDNAKASCYEKQHTSWFRSEQLYGELQQLDASKNLQQAKVQWERQRKHEENEIKEWTQHATKFEARLCPREAELTKRELEMEKAQKTLQGEKVQLLEQYKRVKKDMASVEKHGLLMPYCSYNKPVNTSLLFTLRSNLAYNNNLSLLPSLLR